MNHTVKHLAKKGKANGNMLQMKLLQLQMFLILPNMLNLL